MHLASAAPPPAPQGGNGLSIQAAISAGGRFVAFASSSSNLVQNDTNQGFDIFVRDLATGALTRESVLTSGAQGSGSSLQPAISGDGRIVVFATTVALDPGTPAHFGVFARDRVLGTTTLLNANASGTPGDFGASEPSISADGRFVAFTSSSTNLVPNDTNGVSDIFLADLQTGGLTRVSVTPIGGNANGFSRAPRISSNGRWIVYATRATNLGSPDTNDRLDVYVCDRLSGISTWESTSSQGVAGNGPSGGHPVPGGTEFDGGSISDDGRYLVFESSATNLVPGDTNLRSDIFLRDRQFGTTARINLGPPSGTQCDEDSYHPRISVNGRYVVYSTGSTNLIPGDTLGWEDAFVLDRFPGTTSLVSRSIAGGPGNLASSAAAISDTGRTVVFQSHASDLVSDDPNGGGMDVFALDRGLDHPAYCAGDGSSAPCPCGNVGALGKGCNNSAATGGARIEALGFALVSHDSLQLQAGGMPPATTCLFLQGSAPQAGGQGVAFGDGLRCVGGSIVRLGSKNTVAGSAAYGVPGSGDVPLSIRGGIPASGGLFHYQVWYRNSVSFCTPSTFNLSNGTSVPWLP